MKTIVISENNLKFLAENKDEITYYSFFVQVKNFIQDLLNDPCNAESSKELRDVLDCDNKHVIEKLLDADIIRRTNKIIEHPKELSPDNKSKVRYSIKYSVPKKNFKDKIRTLYNNILQENVSVFADEDKMKQDILDMDIEGVYTKRGGLKLK